MLETFKQNLSSTKMLEDKNNSRGGVSLIPILMLVFPNHQHLDWLPQLFFLFIASELLTDSKL